MRDRTADRRIHVLFLIISQSVGGAELHTISLANGLDKTRFRTSLIYLKNEIDGTDVIDGLGEEVSTFCAGVRKRFDTGAVRKVGDYVSQQSVDVVVCTNEFSLFYGWAALRLQRLRVPLAEVFHTTEPGTRKGRLQMILYRPFFRVADLVVFVCENQRAYWGARKLKVSLASVIHNGIDVTRFRNDFADSETSSVRARFNFAKSDFVIGICASLRPEKAHVDLLGALVVLKAKGHAFKCMVIGDGPERDKIEHVIDESGLRTDVVVTGFMPDVRKYVAACDVMALVSRYVETFSLSALEAMALSKPVIMSEIGGAAEQVTHGHDGLLFPAGDIQALARSILEIKEANVGGKMGANARKSVVERFSVEKMVMKYDEALFALTRRSKTRCQH